MTYVITFEDFTPAPRFDEVSWTGVTIEEAEFQDGPYTQIDTLVIASDTDPEHPLPRSFTTRNATIASGGWYRMTFTDDLGGQGPVTPIKKDTQGEDDFLPGVAQVAREIISRTRDAFTNLLGTFTADTEPTDTQVLNIILDVATLVADEIGDDIPEELWDDAKKVIALRAAMQIETSIFSDQVNTGRSVYPQLKERYEVELGRLQKQAVLLAESGSLSPVDAGPAMRPSFKFPKLERRDDLMRRRL